MRKYENFAKKNVKILQNLIQNFREKWKLNNKRKFREKYRIVRNIYKSKGREIIFMTIKIKYRAVRAENSTSSFEQ